jgi:23S rRNA (uracil1939-C5)-methyltransferase
MNTSQVIIEELGPKGDGASSGPGGKIYIERAVPGDRVTAKIYRDNAGLSRGEILEVLTPSPYRQIPPCPHYDRCGGCTLQHLTPDFYRRWKTETVKEAFRKQGLRPREWKPTLTLSHPHRRRATFAAEMQRGKVVMGYYRRRSDQISDIDTCLVAEPRLLEIRSSLKPFLKDFLVPDRPVDFFLQLVGSSADLVMTGPVGKRGIPDATVRASVAQLLKVSSLSRISWRPSEREVLTLLGSRGSVITTFGPLKVNLPPSAFLQPTVEGEQALVSAVLKALPTKGKFADLFSGCGTFSGPMLTRGSVDAYEALPSAVRSLARAAGRQPLKVFRRDLFRRPLHTEEINRYDAVVFDPPRAGCPEQARKMARAKTRTLIGVSCNPATFARDARLLCDGGYWLQSLEIVDQFMWSHHVEVVGVFTRSRTF